MNQALQHFLQAGQKRIDRVLTKTLNELHGSDPTLLQAMRYSLLSGGKRIRPVLAYASAKAIADLSDATDNVGCAVEAIHAYSLIHDDLPAMDDDDLRRGKATCHIAFNEATAILAGDALQAIAFETLSTAPNIEDRTRIALIRELTRASGAQGMVGGQAIDLASVNQQPELTELQHMHNLKTGALIRASVRMGAIATDSVSHEQLSSLTTYADAIGLAFQVQDDILDVTADTETLGKQQGADIALNKPTYVSLLGLNGAREKAQQLHQNALDSLSDFDDRADILRQLSAYIVMRQK